MESKRVEEEYQAFMEGNLWPLIYQRIGQRSQTYTYTCIEAKKAENKPLNRYRDVNPYDHSRIILQRENFITNYINANLVKMERANRQYILTQGPLVFTSGHFWLMAWEQNSPAIIMLNKIIEKSEIKCHWYWPHENGEKHKVVYPDVNISIAQVKEFDYNYYTVRKLKMTYHETDETRDIWHFHYTTWPDFEVPQSPHAFLDFLSRVEEYGALSCQGGKGPAIVHCSAGIGRSGTFCLVDSVLVLIEKEGQENVDIQEILLEMRRYRMGLIQTSEQLRFSYTAIVEGIKRLDPNYEPPTEAETIEESMYSSVPDEEEAPPLPPPRGESLGRPPARPLPAIPASASMDVVPASSPENVAVAAIAPKQGPVASSSFLTSKFLLWIAVTTILPLPRPKTPEKQWSFLVPLDEFFSEDNDFVRRPVRPAITVNPESVANAPSSPEDSVVEDPSVYESAVSDISLSDDDEWAVERDSSESDEPLTSDLSNIELSSNVESDDSDAGPTPPPRDALPRDMIPRDPPSSASSCDDDDNEDDDTTTETTESIENAAESAVVGGGDGLRRRRAELAERVALMKKRSRDADRWHSFKRSLFKPIALSVGLLAVAGVLIYAYSKH